jgi:hypothetical protein
LKDFAFLYPGFKGDGPASMTRAFIRDFHIWNDFACAHYLANGIHDSAEAAYDALISKFCSPGKSRQNLAFGSHSRHQETQESVFKERVSGETTIILTRHVNEWGFETFNEYHYRVEDGSWMLDEIYYLDECDDDRPLPCL